MTTVNHYKKQLYKVTYKEIVTKMKDDAIAQLSDHVMALIARMQEFERKQQPYMS
ncbi:MAG: hypothetical protein ACJ71K_15315 [Nitrososphaeraceae archaeon]